jgi:chromosome segregation ATPase
MEERQTTPAAPVVGLSLAQIVGDLETRREEIKKQHEAHRVRCLVLEDDLKDATGARDDAASRYHEVSAQIDYLRGLAQPPAARQQQPPA